MDCTNCLAFLVLRKKEVDKYRFRGRRSTFRRGTFARSGAELKSQQFRKVVAGSGADVVAGSSFARSSTDLACSGCGGGVAFSCILGERIILEKHHCIECPLIHRAPRLDG